MTRTITRVRGPGIPPPASRAHDWAGIACAALIAAVNVSVIARFRLPFLEPALGFWFLLIHPAYLLYTTSAWRGSAAAERLGYSLAAALLLLMLAGLAANTFLPLLGVQRPLDTIPVVVLGDTLTAALYLFRRQYPARVRWRTRLQPVEPAESRLLAGSGLSVALAVLGANRLNNGAGDQVSLVALGAIVITLLLLLHARRRVREGVIAVILYLLSLGFC